MGRRGECRHLFKKLKKGHCDQNLVSKRPIYWHQMTVGQLNIDFYIEFSGNHRNFKYDSIVFSQHHSGLYMEKKIEGMER